MVVGVPKGEQLIAWLFGSVIAHLTLPVGITAFEIPTTVVVRVVVPPSVGFDEATTAMIGTCLASETLASELVTVP